MSRISCGESAFLVQKRKMLISPKSLLFCLSTIRSFIPFLCNSKPYAVFILEPSLGPCRLQTHTASSANFLKWLKSKVLKCLVGVASPEASLTGVSIFNQYYIYYLRFLRRLPYPYKFSKDTLRRISKTSRLPLRDP